MEGTCDGERKIQHTDDVLRKKRLLYDIIIID